MADTAYDADHLRQAIAAKGALAVVPTLRALKYPLDKHLSMPSAISSNAASSRLSNSSRRVYGLLQKRPPRNYRAVVTLAAIVLWMR